MADVERIVRVFGSAGKMTDLGRDEEGGKRRLSGSGRRFVANLAVPLSVELLLEPVEFGSLLFIVLQLQGGCPVQEKLL